MKRRITKRPGWTRLGAAGPAKGSVYRHDRSGWEVHHCGLPTALYPYYGVRPGEEKTVPMLLNINGHGYTHLIDAMLGVEFVIAQTTEGQV